jgi:hypothetical protein
MTTDERILALALREMSLALNALIAECMDGDKNIRAPSRQIVMRSRGLLPSYCELALSRKVEK